MRNIIAIILSGGIGFVLRLISFDFLPFKNFADLFLSNIICCFILGCIVSNIILRDSKSDSVKLYSILFLLGGFCVSSYFSIDIIIPKNISIYCFLSFIFSGYFFSLGMKSINVFKYSQTKKAL